MSGNSALQSSWRKSRLDEVCDVILGQSPPGESYNTAGDGLPFYQGKTEFGDLYPTPRKWCSTPTKIAEAEDVLISVRAPVGPTNLCPSRACIGRGLAAVRPRAAMPSRYVLYALRASVDALTEKATGTTFEAVNGSDLRAHVISVAPVAEQNGIVAEIEKQFTRLDAGVAALRRVQSNLKRYRAAVLKAACEGRLVPTEAELARREGRGFETGEELLGRILEERRKNWKGRGKYKEPASPQIDKPQAQPEGWCWAAVEQLLREPLCNGVSVKGSDDPPGVRALRLSAMSNSGFDYTDFRYLPLSDSDIDDLWITEGDFFMSRGNGSLHLVGRGTFAQKAPYPIIFPDTMIRLRFTDAIRRSGWIPALWPSRTLRSQIEGSVKTTAGIYKIAQPQVERIIVPLPPLAEQTRIVAEVERRLSVVVELEAVVAANLKRAARLRQAVLQRAFEGRLA